MKQDNSLRKEKILLIIGLGLIGLGLIGNGWTVPLLFPPNQSHQLAEFSLKVWVFDLIFVLTGFLLIRFRSKYKLLLDVLVGIMISVLLLVGIESVFYIINTSGQKSDRTVWFEGGDIYRTDDILGYKPEAQAQVHSLKKINGQVIYDVIYSTDEYSRRITPLPNLKDRNKFILFFGDSFTFGDGVNDDETLPFYVAQLAPDYQPYNYGFSGYGPQQMLAKLQSEHLNQEIKEKEGLVIYTFIDDHVPRSIGSMAVYNQWGRLMPFYTLDANNNLVRQGNFTSGRPLLSALYIILGKSQTAKYFNINLPPGLYEHHFALTAKIIETARDTFVEKFGHDNFYVLFFPDVSERANRIIPYLEKAGIKYLDYSTLYDHSRSDLWIKGDAHPTAQGYKSVATTLVKDLKISGVK
jgi:hypothetical protein